MNRRWVVCVGVFCGSDLYTGVCACVLYCTLYLVTHFFSTYISHFIFCMWISRMYLSDTLRLIAFCVQNIISFSAPLTTGCHLAQGNQYWCCVRKAGDEGATGEIHKTIESVKIVSVYLSFQNNKIKVMVSNKCYDNCQNISIMNL